MTTAVRDALQNVPKIIHGLEPTFELTKDILLPPVKAIAAKVSELWAFLQPYLSKIWSFASSQPGISVELVAAAFIPIQLAQSVDNKVLSTALIAAGILIAETGGYMLCASGAVPTLLAQITKVLPF